ncbi:MAG: helix-turn-helix domain-containing protein, partial [Actinomycetota bacterium]|nr:helix-turn-helix domain-containing protein [Actinomycetota bacterium]
MAPAMSIARRVAQVLDCFGPSDPELGIREIARRSSLPPSTTHRLVAELVELGYLERSANGSVMLGL